MVFSAFTDFENCGSNNDDQAIEGLWAEIKKDAVDLFNADPHVALAEGDETNFMPRCTIYVADHEFEAGGDTLHHALEMAHSEMLHEAAREGRGEGGETVTICTGSGARNVLMVFSPRWKRSLCGTTEGVISAVLKRNCVMHKNALPLS